MSEHYPQIRLYGVFDNGRFLRIRESVGITFYMRRNHQEVLPAVTPSHRMRLENMRTH